MKFRTLEANEIECRVATVKSTGVTLLLYKDARCDMNILDEEVGQMNWQRSHSRENANCIVSIWDETKKQWISKEDTGTESYTEKEKGLASDSFKRACFNWGIGRELYTAPFVWIPSSNCNIVSKGTGYTCYDKFYVSEIGYDDKRNINKLEIRDSKTENVVFTYGAIIRNLEPERASEAQISTIVSICKKHKIEPEMLYSSNDLSKDTLTAEQAGKLLQALKKKFGDD